jgi:hypothetical protein
MPREVGGRATRGKPVPAERDYGAGSLTVD